MCGPTDPDPNAVTFKAEIVRSWNARGSGTTACHARDQYAATENMDSRGWLTLENADLGSERYSA